MPIVNFAVAAVAVIAVVGAVSSYFEKYLTTSVSQWVGHDLRRTLYHHIQRLSLAEHDEARSGDLITRVTSDIEAVQDFINSALLGMLVNVMTLVGMIGVMFYLNWRFTLIALSVSPVLFLVVYYFTRRIKKASRAVRKKEGELLSIVQEVLTSIRVVQAFAREDYEQKRFESESLANVEAGLEARSIKATLAPDRGGHRRRRDVSGPRVRRAPGAGRRSQRRRADRLPAVSGEDVQADARPLEDDRHGLQGDGRLRAHSGSAGDRKPRAGHAGRATRLQSSRGASPSTTSASATTTASRS